MAKTFKYSSVFPKLKIRNTEKYGKGVFAVENIKKGTIIYVLGGERVLSNDLVERVISGREKIDDPLQVGKRTYIDLDKISRIFNHSCDQNAGLRKKSEMFALRDIKTGEEITFDYSLTVAPTEWRMECKCGAPNCRKVLGDISTVPKRRVREYKILGALQDYMKKLLKQIEAGEYELPKYELAALDKLKRAHLCRRAVGLRKTGATPDLPPP